MESWTILLGVIRDNMVSKGRVYILFISGVIHVINILLSKQPVISAPILAVTSKILNNLAKLN